VTVILDPYSDKTDQNGTSPGDCSLRDLLAYLQRRFDPHETARHYRESPWLTVQEVARELRLSTSIVYRLIHHGELKAVDVVDRNGAVPARGHYRIRRSSLDEYLASREVKQPLTQVTPPHAPRQPQKVRNHLGL
jgi:excisionase family DNA binding protein